MIQLISREDTLKECAERFFKKEIRYRYSTCVVVMNLHQSGAYSMKEIIERYETEDFPINEDFKTCCEEFRFVSERETNETLEYSDQLYTLKEIREFYNSIWKPCYDSINC